MFGKNDNSAAQESQRAIEAGGLPPAASARLKENASRQNTPQHLFSSNFSVNELLLTRECGYEPLGQVMGTSVMHIGWQFMPYGASAWSTPQSQELDTLSGAHRDARDRAINRLVQEAEILKADGVVGARVLISNAGLTPDAMEFQVIGTAVRKIGSSSQVARRPFVSNLNGQDHWALRQAGYRPVGFAFGNCSWYQVSGWTNQMLDYSWGGSRELPDFTQGIYNSRELAMARLQADAVQYRGIGVVGVEILPHIRFVEREQQNSSVRDLIAEFTIYGTVVAWEEGRLAAQPILQTIALEGVL